MQNRITESVVEVPRRSRIGCVETMGACDTAASTPTTLWSSQDTRIVGPKPWRHFTPRLSTVVDDDWHARDDHATKSPLSTTTTPDQVCGVDSSRQSEIGGVDFGAEGMGRVNALAARCWYPAATSSFWIRSACALHTVAGSSVWVQKRLHNLRSGSDRVFTGTS